MTKRTKKILIAEDDTFLGDMMAQVMTMNGASPSVARNGKEAMQILEKGSFDLLLLDILMPESDGYDVLEFMKKKKISTPVVVVSNLSSGDVRARCKEYNCSAFVVKSDVDDDTLWGIVKKHLK